MPGVIVKREGTRDRTARQAASGHEGWGGNVTGYALSAPRPGVQSARCVRDIMQVGYH
jgi:hypothetical protein